MPVSSALLRLLDCKPFRGRSGPEDQIAMAVANMLRAEALSGNLIGTFTHIPNEIGGGNSSSRVRYALAKAMGLISGAPDYVFAWPGGSGWIELKTKTGTLNPNQRDFRQWCADTGVLFATCRSVNEVIATLREWGALKNRVEEICE